VNGQFDSTLPLGLGVRAAGGNSSAFT
jgi:hypothetical protein